MSDKENKVVEDYTKAIKMGDIVPNKRPVTKQDVDKFVEKKKKEIAIKEMLDEKQDKKSKTKEPEEIISKKSIFSKD